MNAGFNRFSPVSKVLLNPDTPPVNPHPWDDEFDVDGVLDGKWTAVNYNGASTIETIVNSRYYLTDVARNTRLMGIEQAIGSPGSFRVRLKWEMEAGIANYNGCGIGFKNSGNGRYVWLGVLFNSGSGYCSPYCIRCSNATTYVSEVYIASWTLASHGYMEVEYNGTSLLLKTSISGLNFPTVLTEAIATYLAAAPTHLGPMSHHYGIAIAHSYDWFRKVQL